MVSVGYHAHRRPDCGAVRVGDVTYEILSRRFVTMLLAVLY